MLTLEVLSEEIRGCHRCSLRKDDEPVPGIGPMNAGLMVIAEKPESDDILLGRPFEGRGGRLTKQLLVDAGLSSGVFYTTAVKCSSRQSPKAAAFRECNQWLWDEIELVKPKLLLALGAKAAASIGLKFEPGRISRVLREPNPLGATWHSPHVLLNGGRKLTEATASFLKSIRECL